MYYPAVPSTTRTVSPVPVREVPEEWSPGSIRPSPYDPANIVPFNSDFERAARLGVDIGAAFQTAHSLGKSAVKVWRFLSGSKGGREKVTTLKDFWEAVDGPLAEYDPIITPASPRGQSRLSEGYKLDRRSSKQYKGLLELAKEKPKLARNVHNKMVREIPEYGEWVARQNDKPGAMARHGADIAPRPQMLPDDVNKINVPPKLVEKIPVSKRDAYIAGKYNSDPYFRYGLNRPSASVSNSGPRVGLGGSPVGKNTPTQLAFKWLARSNGLDVAKQAAAEWNRLRKAGKNVGPLDEWLGEGFLLDHGVSPWYPKKKGMPNESWDAMDFDRGAIKSLVERLNEQKSKWRLSDDQTKEAERALRRAQGSHIVHREALPAFEQLTGSEAFRGRMGSPGNTLGHTFSEWDVSDVKDIDTSTGLVFDSWRRANGISGSELDEATKAAIRMDRAATARHEAIHGMPMSAEETKAANSIFGFFNDMTGMKRLTDIGMADVPKGAHGVIENYFTLRGSTEIKARAMQLKDWIAERHGIPLNTDFKITGEMLDDGLSTYLHSPYTAKNNMHEFITGIKDKDALLDYMNRYALGVTPFVGMEANNRKGRFSK